jgi:subfamily B ATP-binding cassette protein MsbA
MANPNPDDDRRTPLTKVRGLAHMLPEAWVFMRPQRALLLFGFALIGLNRVAGLVLPASTKYLFDNIIGKREVQYLRPLVLAILAATIIQGLSSYTLTQVLSKAAQRMITDLRKQVQTHVGRLPIAFHDANKTGALVNRIMNDVEGLRNLIGTGLVEFAGGVLTSILAFGMLLRLSPLLTAVAFSILLLVGAALNKAIGTIRPIYRARSKLNAEVNARLTESLAGVRVVKGYHAEAREEQVFARNVQRLLENILKTLTATSVMSLSSTMILGVVSGLIIFLGAHRILNGSMTIGAFVTFSAFLALLIAPVLQIVGIGSQLTEGLAGLERTQEIMVEAREDADPRRRVVLGPIRGEVVFDHVDFAYTAGKTVLWDVSLRAEPGTVTALVGASGAGKSTIIGLIAAFYTPSAGQVLVDGVDLSTVQLSSFRNQLGVVLQETFLFDGTIRENVAFSRPNASEEEIMEACRIARVDEFADAFELKYDTVVGERGVRLSGGQRQRVSIARALIADPRILILDEATSSLDSESEAMIQQGLAVLMRGRTTFVIAHRLSTIRRADQILVVEAGRIIERGNHASLYALGGRYYDLYTRQHGIESNLFLAPGEGQNNLDAPAEANSGAGRSRAGGANDGDPDGSPGQRVRLLPKQDV